MKKGFSLVELSVVLAVIGITLSGALTLATKKTESDKITETENKMAIIETRLIAFIHQSTAANKNRLPCPSDNSLAISNTNFGKEAAHTGTYRCVVTAGGNYNSSNAYSGGVPTNSLQLPDDYAFDGWDRRFTYVVDYRFTNNISTNPVTCTETGEICLRFTPTGSITINDASALPVTSEAVYAIISHGRNGLGAWPYNGGTTRLAAPTDTDELNNAQGGGGSYGAFDTTFVQKATTSTYDDIVTYKTKSQLLVDANYLDDKTLCDSAEDITNNPGANLTCANATNVSICESFGTRVYDYLCLDR